MKGEARFISPILAMEVVVFVASAVDFERRWLAARTPGWLAAALSAFLTVSSVRKLTVRVVRVTEGD